MSSIVHKVKDALKPSHESGQEGYDQTHTSSGMHGQTSMPGAFDSGTGGDPTHSGHSGAKGYGMGNTTSQTYDSSGRPTHGSGLGHDTTHSTSKYSSEPTQSSYTHDQGRTHHGDGHGTTGTVAGAGARAAALSSREGHSANRVPEEHLMDPAESGDGSNIMQRARGDYANDTIDTGSNKLHKRDAPRANYDNSGRAARHDQEAILKQQQGDSTIRQPDYGTTTSTSGYDQTDKSSREPVHNSNLMNKLDPRVDSSKTSAHDRDASRLDKESGITGGTGVGAAGLGATGATAASHHQSKFDRDDHGSHPTSARDTYGTTDRKPALPSRPRDDYSAATAGSGVDRRDQVSNPVGTGNYSSRHPDPYSAQTQSTTDPNYHSTTTTTSSVPLSSASTNPAHHRHEQAKHSSHPVPAQAVPYSMTGAHTSGHDAGADIISSIRSHFHCMSCGHKNDASHLRDAQGGAVSGRTALHCMNCGHKNEVGHMLR